MDPKKFIGLDSVADAVEYLHSGSSLGKVSFQAQFEKKKKKFCLVISLVINFFPLLFLLKLVKDDILISKLQVVVCIDPTFSQKVSRL